MASLMQSSGRARTRPAVAISASLAESGSTRSRPLWRSPAMTKTAITANPSTSARSTHGRSRRDEQQPDQSNSGTISGCVRRRGMDDRDSRRVAAHAMAATSGQPRSVRYVSSCPDRSGEESKGRDRPSDRRPAFAPQTEGRLPDMIRDFLALSRDLENWREPSWLALSASQRDSLGENRLPSHDMAGHQRLCLVFETQLDDLDNAVVLRH